MPTINSRDATPAEEPELEKERLGANDRLIVTFSEVFRGFKDKALEEQDLTDGLQFGTDPRSSHILLGYRGTRGISAKQYVITVDVELCIWLRDYHSAHGTAVGCNGQNKMKVRKRDRWILAYSAGTQNIFEEITIHSGGLAVSAEFPNHARADPQYLENLRAFVTTLKKAAENRRNQVAAVEKLGLDGDPTTGAPSEAQTPGERLIYYNDRRIGKGAFGEVHRVIQARNGRYFAAKTFLRPANKRPLDEADPAWLARIRREFTIMRENPHVGTPWLFTAVTKALIKEQPNVMKIFEFRTDPEPVIIMAYYPIGNIADANIVSETTYISAFGQIIDGLKHLHENGVVHRDLKPENFLVEMEPFKVVITDFGLAKVVADSTLLKTFCGTLKYLAPEVFPGLSDGHGPPVDVWSLGVIVFEWIYGIPAAPAVPAVNKKENTIRPEKWHEWISTWSGWLLIKLDNEDDCLLVQTLLGMIEIRAKNRWSASRCLEHGLRSRLFRRRETDGLVVCADGPDGIIVKDMEKLERNETTTKGSQRGTQTMMQAEGLSTTSVKPAPLESATPPAEQDFVRRESRSPLRQPTVTDYDAKHVQMKIGSKTVLMRKQDCFVNAVQILALTDKNQQERSSLLAIMKKKTKVELYTAPNQHICTWVNFRDGRILCRHLKLEEKLQPLLDYGVRSLPHNYSGAVEEEYDYLAEEPPYFTITVLSQSIRVRMSDLRIHAGDIVRASGREPKKTVERIRDNLPDKAYDILRGYTGYSGTYVDFQVGINLCRKYLLNKLVEQFHILKASLKRPVSGVESSQERPSSSQITTPLAIGTRLESVLAQRSSIDPGEIWNEAETPTSARKGRNSQAEHPQTQRDVSLQTQRLLPPHQPDNNAQNVFHDDSHPISPRTGSHYSIWASEPHSHLSEVKPDLKPYSWASRSSYGGFSDTGYS